MLAHRPLAAAAATMSAALLALVALSGCAAAAAGPLSAGALPAGAERVAVIGDSIESGLGLDPDESWPALLAATRGWQLSNLSVPGAGFVAQGSDGNDFSAQVASAIASRPQLVLIGASDNDLGTDPATVEKAAQKAVDEIRTALPDARIIGYNALTGEAGDDDLAPLNTALKKAVEASGGTWIDLGQPYRGRAGLVQDDGEHPTLPGQQAIAAAVGAALPD